MSIRASSKRVGKSSTTGYMIIKKFAPIMICNLMCWVPLVICSALSGAGVSIHPILVTWLVIVFLPINALTDPLFFTLLNPDMHTKLCGKKKF